MNSLQPIIVEVVVNAPIENVWEFWTMPEHIVNWAFASDDWKAPHAENDLQKGGTFKTVMGAKDKSESFDFTGTYTDVKEHALIEYDMSDGRHVKTEFVQLPEGVRITQTFDPEKINFEDMQRSGWQAILNNFKEYAEKISTQ